MLNYIRKYKLLYWLPYALLLAVTVAVLILLRNGVYVDLSLDSFFDGFLVCLFMVIWANFCNGLANKCYTKRISLLNDQCDPEVFLKENKYSYKKALKVRRFTKPRQRAAAIIQNYQIIALIIAGRYEEALQAEELLSKCAQNSNNYADIRAVCLICRASAYIYRNAEGDIAAAREHVIKAKELLGKRSIASNIADGVTLLEYRLDAVEGKNLQGCLEYFTRQAENAADVRGETHCRDYMALIFRQLGDTENERAQLELAAQKAPKTEIGKRAAARLAELAAQ